MIIHLLVLRDDLLIILFSILVGLGTDDHPTPRLPKTAGKEGDSGGLETDTTQQQLPLQVRLPGCLHPVHLLVAGDCSDAEVLTQRILQFVYFFDG